MPGDSCILTIVYETAHSNVPAAASYIAWAEVSGKYSLTITSEHLPVLESPGFIFKGWSYNGEIISEGYVFTISENTTVTFIAVWEALYVVESYAAIARIADQLRALTNKTDKMSIEQMTQEAADANTCKADILSALTAKGVDTTGAGLDDIAALMESIRAGGIEGKSFDTGTMVLSFRENVMDVNGFRFEIEHNLGRVPCLVFLFCLDSTSGNGDIVAITAFNSPVAFSSQNLRVSNITTLQNGEFYKKYSSASQTDLWTETEVYIPIGGGTASTYLAAGVEWIWVVA